MSISLKVIITQLLEIKIYYKEIIVILMEAIMQLMAIKIRSMAIKTVLLEI